MKPALLLVDLQNDYLQTPGLQPPADAVVRRTASLLAACRRRRVPVIHVWTTVHRDRDERLPHWRRDDRWICVADTPGHQPPDALAPLNGEAIVHKSGFNAFVGPGLGAELRRINCDTVIVAGLHLHACVRAVALECLERGFHVHVADDLVATNDPIHAAASRRWLAERCVRFDSATALLARLDAGQPPALIHRSPRRTDQVLFEVRVDGAGEIAAAVAAAQAAWANWRRTAWPARQQALENVAARLEAAIPELSRQIAVEIGKPVSHAIEEIRRAAANVRDVIRRVAATAGQRREGGGAVRRQPVGVIAVISAWNNPVAIPLGKIAPALAWGNAVVWKPAPAAARISQTLLNLLRAAGVPPDAVRLVSGDHTTAQQLAANERIDAVTLTGSLAAGFAIQEICARRMVPLQAELSGNNAAIVWDDADFARAAAQVAWGAFAFAGQRCTANRRVIVPASRAADLAEKIQSAAERLPFGDPLEAATEIGPVIGEARRDEIAALTAEAERKGCDVLRVGPARADEPWVKAGAYARPVIVRCDRPDDELVQEETMGPLLVVQPADDFDHALALCNGVRHGLIAALFSNSPGCRQKFLEEARAGVLKLNAATAGVDVTLPFGGWKSSGIGPPEHGEADCLFYTRLQAIYDAPA